MTDKEIKQKNTELEQELDAARLEVERLRGALKKFGQHLSQCGIGGAYKEGDCDCGLAQALAAQKGGE